MQPGFDTQQVFCPNCGAPAPFRGTAVSLVCEYCESTIVRTGVDVSLVGKVSALLDTGSPILLHSRGKFDNLPFEVAGRLQVQYLRGTWNEWFINFADGTVGWLADAQGQYAVVRPVSADIVANRVPPFSELGVGLELRIGNTPAVITDFRGASYQGAEGMLPFDAQPGITFYSADLRGYDGEYFTLDYGNQGEHQQPVPYQGRAVRLNEVELHPLRTFEGWRR